MHTSIWFYPASTETPISPVPFTYLLHQSQSCCRQCAGKWTTGTRDKVPGSVQMKNISAGLMGLVFLLSLFLRDSAKNSERPIVTSGSLVPSSKLGCKSPWDLITTFHPALLCMNKSHQPCSAVFNVEKGAAVLFTSRSTTKSISPDN